MTPGSPPELCLCLRHKMLLRSWEKATERGILGQTRKLRGLNFIEGSRAIGDNSTPWHPTFTFASFDIIVIDFVMHNHHKMIPFYVGHVDNQTFMDSWGYQAPDDPMHRIVTLTVGISGRYFNNIGEKCYTAIATPGKTACKLYTWIKYGG